MKLIKLALILLSTQTFATSVVKIKCTGPELTYVNRFSLEQNIELFSSQNDDEWNLYSTQIDFDATRAGTNSEVKNKTLKSLRGTLKKINGNFTKEPFYNLKLKNKDNSILINLNLNYPGKLTSKIRTADGYLYKSTCELVGFKQCLFEGSIVDTFEASGVTKVEFGEELKVIPNFNEDNTPVNTKKVSLTYPNGVIYYVWYTFEDDVDGGNTYGVFEDSNGLVVATVNDSDINNCTVTK